ncbi:MAG: hypothetical protein ABL866_16525 [Devosia sp.]
MYRPRAFPDRRLSAKSAFSRGSSEENAAPAPAPSSERLGRFLDHPVTRGIVLLLEMVALVVAVPALVFEAQQARLALEANADSRRMGAYQLLSSTTSYEVVWQAIKVLVESGDTLQGVTASCASETCTSINGLTIVTPGTSSQGHTGVRNIVADNVMFRDAHFDGVQFIGGSMKSLSFVNSWLEVDFENVDLTGANFSWSEYESPQKLALTDPKTWTESKLSISGGRVSQASFVAPDLSGLSLSFLDLSGTYFKGSFNPRPGAMLENYYVETHPPRLAGGVKIEQLAAYRCAKAPEGSANPDFFAQNCVFIGTDDMLMQRETSSRSKGR